MRQHVVAVLGSILLFTVLPCRANVTFNAGNHPQPGEENILLNTGTSGSTVFGVGNDTGIQVAFSSSSDSLLEPANGQARISPSSGLLNNLTISVPGGTFEDLIFNPFKGSGSATLTVIANEPGGSPMTFTSSFALGNGNNFFTIVATDGETLSSVTIDSAAGFTALQQPRISGARLGAPTAPELVSTLATLGLSMIGLIGLGSAWARKEHDLGNG